MRYLLLIHLNEKTMDGLPAAEMHDLNVRHLALNDDLRRSGRFIEAEALEPAGRTVCVRIREGKASVTDGPFAETKEQVAGFYLVEARDVDEAVRIAQRMPSLPFGAVEVRPVRTLVVEDSGPRQA